MTAITTDVPDATTITAITIVVPDATTIEALTTVVSVIPDAAERVVLFTACLPDINAKIALNSPERLILRH